MPHRPTVSARGLRGLLAYAASQGADVVSITSACGLELADLEDPELRVPRDRWARVWELVEAELGDPAIALHVAEAIPFGAFDVVDYVAATSPTFAEGLRRVSKYFRLIHDQTAFEIDDAGVLRHFMYGEPLGAMRYAAEFSLASVVTRFRHSTRAAIGALEVRFRHPAPAMGADVYPAFFGGPVRFDAGENAIVLDPTALALPNMRADELLNEVLRRHAEAQIARLPDASTAEESVRDALRRAFIDGEPTVDDVSRRLNTSSRTLQRRLQEEATSFNEILDDERRAIAVRFLTGSRMSISEVGFLLGFSDPSAFHRAFRRWTGQTPGDFRRAGAT